MPSAAPPPPFPSPGWSVSPSGSSLPTTRPAVSGAQGGHLVLSVPRAYGRRPSSHTSDPCLLAQPGEGDQAY